LAAVVLVTTVALVLVVALVLILYFQLLPPLKVEVVAELTLIQLLGLMAQVEVGVLILQYNALVHLERLVREPLADSTQPTEVRHTQQVVVAELAQWVEMDQELTLAVLAETVLPLRLLVHP
jgi:hypothetical protein